MLVSELEEVSEKWHARNLRKVLDLWGVGAVEIADEEVDKRNQRDSGGL